MYEKASKVCAELGTTIEEVTVEFLKFCIVPENLPRDERNSRHRKSTCVITGADSE